MLTLEIINGLLVRFEWYKSHQATFMMRVKR
jgi:hypothetical protein